MNPEKRSYPLPPMGRTQQTASALRVRLEKSLWQLQRNGTGRTPMEVRIRFRGLKSRVIWQDLIERELVRLETLNEITGADVAVEWGTELQPPFKVQVRLEVPGPDYHAEARDHTVPAAVMKAVRSIEKQMRGRRIQQSRRVKDSGQVRMASQR